MLYTGHRDADRGSHQVIRLAVAYGAFILNKDQVKGVAKQVKGKINEVIGRATGDGKQEIKGDVQQAVGGAQKKLGDVKQAIKAQTRKRR